MTTQSKYSPVSNTCVHKTESSHISLCMPCVYVLACILRMFLGIDGYNSVMHRTVSDIGTGLFGTDPKLGQTTSKLINSLLSSKQPCVLGNANDARCDVLNTVLPRSQLTQNVMLCHWVNKFLKHHSAFIITPRHFFLDCSTSEDEGTMNLQNGGKYSPTDSVKSQTWILSNEPNSNYKLRYVTESLTAHSHW